jgi:hypothetical protein
MVVPWSESGDPDTSLHRYAGSFSLHYPGVCGERDERLLGDNKYQKGIYPSDFELGMHARAAAMQFELLG